MAKVVKLKGLRSADVVKRIKRGDIFIYPTDTIYGIGCNALLPEAVKRIREIKKRTDKPFSIIAPSKAWIEKHFKINKAYLEKLPGPFTYILKPKKKELFGKEVSKFETVGVRIPDHKFTRFVEKSGVPFITTSVNFSGQEPATAIKKIPKEIIEQVDIVIDDGILDNNPSTVLDLTKSIPRILRK